MARRYGTVSIDGVPVASYPATRGFIISTMTIPWQFLNALCESLGYEDPCVGIFGGEEPSTREVAPHVYHNSCELEVRLCAVRHEDGRTVADYVNPRAKFTIGWLGVNDYSEVPS